MSDARALLAAIVGHPDEDTPRLMYADWLEEHGDAGRAEFVRLQVERSRTDRADPRWRELLSREAELAVVAKRTWLKPYLAWADLYNLTIRRGLVESAATTAAALAPHLGTLRDLIGLLELHVHCQHDTSLPAPPEPPPRRRGWFGAAVRRVVSGGEPPPGELCPLGLTPRPPGLRVRVPLGTRHVGPRREDLFLDLLDPDGAEPDPPLRAGTWVVLLWHPDAPDEARLVPRLARALCAQAQHASDALFRLNVAARPVRAADAVATWAGLLAADAGPVWVRFQDGEPDERVVGDRPPAGWLGGVSL